MLGSCQHNSSFVRAGTVWIPGEESITEALGEVSLLLRSNKREKISVMVPFLHSESHARGIFCFCDQILTLSLLQ